MTNCESGEKDASSGIDFEFMCPVKVCITCPEKASISRMKDPLVEMRMVLPSGENFSPVQSKSFSAAREKTVYLFVMCVRAVLLIFKDFC